jgi:colanic acid/amylovoran biosynthesis glycosyltransferase
VITGCHVFRVCKELDIPIIATGLGYDLSIYELLKKHEAKYKEFLNYCSAVVIVAKSMSKTLIQLGLNPNKIVHSPAGATQSFLDIQPTYEGEQIFGIGRFIDKKAPHLSILAFSFVLKKFPKAKLVLAGDGPLLHFCKDIVKGLNMETSVEFVEKINQDQQREYLAKSVMFIQHSRTAIDGDAEGTPVAIVEASAAGLPIVSTLHSGIMDVVIQNKTGLLVDEGDVTAMAEKIIYLLENREELKLMGELAKENIRQNFTLDHHLKKIEETIIKVFTPH